MESIAERIKELIDDQGLTNTDFAKETNLNPAIISHILGGRNKPSLQVVNQIKDRFTNVNLDYLITGQGQLYTDFTNVKEVVSAPEPSLFSNATGGFPMEGVRVVSEPGTIPQKAEEEEKAEQPPTASTPRPSLSLDKKSEPEIRSESTDKKDIEQIVIFYTDGSFKAYKP